MTTVVGLKLSRAKFKSLDRILVRALRGTPFASFIGEAQRIAEARNAKEVLEDRETHVPWDAEGVLMGAMRFGLDAWERRYFGEEDL
jgi:hypothetical protein